ncbi:MAG TPA: hypothetical protein VLK37_11525 [Solirubrobacterales bacterium]|nr:hypothetical protein [Solirubrobacterales bacterium]
MGRLLRRTKATSAAAVSCCLALALLGVAASSASADPEAQPVWSYKSVFGGGEFSETLHETPRSPLALDGSGNIFGADQGLGKVLIYSPTPEGGTPLTTISPGKFRNVAIDPADDSLYFDEDESEGGTTIGRYLSDGQPTPTYTLDPTFEVPQGQGIAVDPTSGDLLVAAPAAEAVRRYDSSGTLTATIATTSINPSWIAIAPDGSFYVASVDGPDVYRYSGAGTALGTISGVGQLHGLAYDPSRSLLVASVGDKLKSYSPAGALRSESQANGESGIGLAAGADGLLYERTVPDLRLYVPATAPGVDAPAVSAVAVHSVNVSAEVDPGEELGGEAPAGSYARIEYSSDGGQSWPFSTPDQALSEGGDTEVEADLTELKGNFDYLVRVVVGNPVFGSTTSVTAPFHTILGPPEVETGKATSITDDEAELNGTIDAIGDQTTYRFEYGPTTAYGSKAPAGADGIAGNGTAPRAFSRPISGLQPSTTYHYRVVAKNSAGEVAGVDKTFTTLVAGQPEARSFELVTPVDKEAGVIQQLYGFQTAPDGSALVMHLVSPPDDTETNVLSNRYLTRRSPSGWLPWISPDPPQDVSRSYVDSVTQAVSPDFQHALVVSNRALTPGAYEGGGNIYIRDLETGSYTFVGGAPGLSPYNKMSGLQTQDMYRGGADDFDWVVLAATSPLYPGAPQTGIYRWSRAGGLELESRLPDGTPAPGVQAILFSYIYKQVEVSDDGRTLYFSAWEGSAGVYRRSEGQTIPISVSEIPGDAATPHGGRLDGVSRDGRYAFFRSQARLTSDAPSSPGNGAFLYRYDAEPGDIEFVGVATSEDAGRVRGVSDDGETIYYNNESNTVVWSGGVTHEITTEHPDGGTEFGAQMFFSSSGRFLGWPSTVDDSIYLYDAETDEKVCVNCDEEGVPLGQSRLPGGVRTLSNYEPGVVANEGAMYFDSTAPLLAADHNQAYDVYRYRDGNLTLISPGDGPFGAQFSDATPDGSHVFFTTEEGIVSWDGDDAVDVYDSRSGGTPAKPPVNSPECVGDACQGAAGTAPGAPGLRSDGPSGAQGAAGKISALRKLSARQRSTLAKGGKATLRLSVDAPGTVSVTGKARIDGKKRQVVTASVNAGKAGQIGIPFAISKTALDELKTRGSLTVTLSVRLGDSVAKKVSFTLRAPTGEKGGRS